MRSWHLRNSFFTASMLARTLVVVGIVSSPMFGLERADAGDDGTLTLEYSKAEERFKGTRTGSDDVGCAGESITLKRVRPGKDMKIAVATTDGSGNYEVPSKDPKPARYRAVDTFAEFNDCASSTRLSAKIVIRE